MYGLIAQRRILGLSTHIPNFNGSFNQLKFEGFVFQCGSCTCVLPSITVLTGFAGCVLFLVCNPVSLTCHSCSLGGKLGQMHGPAINLYSHQYLQLSACLSLFNQAGFVYLVEQSQPPAYQGVCACAGERGERMGRLPNTTNSSTNLIASR